MDQFSEVQVKLYVHIPPVFAGDLKAGVRTKLDRLLMRWSDECQGILISYSDVRPLQRCGRILYDSPYLHFEVAAKFIAFCPVVGSQICGIVNKQSVDHIGLLIHESFNASLPSAQLKKMFKWSTELQAWVSRRDGVAVDLSSSVQFTISDVDVKDYHVSIQGELHKRSNDGIADEASK